MWLGNCEERHNCVTSKVCICRDENYLKDSKNKEDNELKVWSRLVDKIENRIREGKPLKFIRCGLARV